MISARNRLFEAETSEKQRESVGILALAALALLLLVFWMAFQAWVDLREDVGALRGRVERLEQRKR